MLLRIFLINSAYFCVLTCDINIKETDYYEERSIVTTRTGKIKQTVQKQGHILKSDYTYLDHILPWYKKHLPPPNQDINLVLSLRYDNVINAHQKQEILTSRIRLSYTYTDQRLAWENITNPVLKSRVLNHFQEGILVTPSLLWRPHLILANAVHWMEITPPMALVRKNGRITYQQYLLLDTNCNFELERFPFDKQTCLIIFEGATFEKAFKQFDIKKLEVENQTSIGGMLVKNNEWELVRVGKLYTGEQRAESYAGTFEVIIKRKPTFYLRYLVLPEILLTLLTFCSFLLPSDAGHQKVSFGLTCLLSMTVFMLILAEQMPATDHGTPVIDDYFGYLCMNISLIVVCNAITVHYHNKGLKVNIEKPAKILQFLFLNTTDNCKTILSCQKWDNENITVGESKAALRKASHKHIMQLLDLTAPFLEVKSPNTQDLAKENDTASTCTDANNFPRLPSGMRVSSFCNTPNGQRSSSVRDFMHIEKDNFNAKTKDLQKDYLTVKTKDQEVRDRLGDALEEAERIEQFKLIAQRMNFCFAVVCIVFFISITCYMILSLLLLHEGHPLEFANQ